MIKHRIFLLSSGLVLFSGDEAGAQIRSVTLTEQCNDSTDLCPGAACAACAEIELWAPHDVVQLQAGEEFTLSRIDTDIGNETPVGIFIAEQPTKASANVYRLDAYDRMIRLDQDFSPWLRDHQADFPMTIPDIVAAACEVCGVELAAGTMDGLPNADYQVQAFYSDGITGRQIIQWAGEAFCRFARMTADGRLEFAWYVARGYEMIGPSAELRPGYVRLADRILGTARRELYRVQFQQQAYLQGTLSYEQYSTALVEKVQIRQSDTDVGVVYPPDATGTNALVLQGNLLLTANSQAQLEPVAQAIWQELTFGAPVPGPNNMLVRMAGEVLAAAPDGALYMVKSSAISYTPLKVSALAAGGILPRPGDVITVTDAYGRQMVTYVMRRTISGQKVTLESTGNARRDSSTAINRAKFTNTAGKIFELQIGIDGLKINTEDLQQKQAQLEFDLDGLSSTVSANYDALKKYADDAANQARDDAIQSAVDQAEEALNTELELYPTKVEMNSAISQSASEISSQVSLTLEGYSTKEYTDSANRDAKSYADAAAQAALVEANRATDGKLAQYPTKIEMNSAITQSASQITSEVSLTLEQYSTTEESEAYSDQAAGAAEDAANEATDNKLQNYSTTVQMNSAIQQSANNINLQVSQTLTQYSTTEESEAYADQAAGNAEDAANEATDAKLQNYSTTVQMQAAIDLAVDGISLEVTNNGTSSTLTLKSGGTVLSSPQINITGFVTFSNLSTSGQTTINAGNVTTGTLAASLLRTGTISGSSGTSGWNLDNGSFRSGPSGGTRVEIEAGGLRTYSNGYLTGVMTHKYGQSAYCCNSATTCLGWTNSANGPGTGAAHYRPWYGSQDDGTFRGLIYDDSDRSVGIGRYVNFGLQNGSKNKIINSSFGLIGIESMESPEPTFWDMGSGVCDGSGECLILLDPRYVEAIDRRYRPRWLITPTDALGPLWVEKQHLGAIVHGAPWQTFDWAVNAAQQECAEKYAPEVNGGTRKIEVTLIDAQDDTDAESEQDLLAALRLLEDDAQDTLSSLLKEATA